MRHFIRLPALFVFAFAANLVSQQQPPKFRGGIALVTMDVTALGSDGWPIRDLGAEELTLTVNGRERSLKSFELIEVAPRTITGAKPASETAPAAASNLATPRRSVFFVIFHDHISQGNERQPIQGAMAFIDRLEQRDRVAVITMPFGRVEVDLTTDHALAKTRLGHIVGHSQSATGNETTSESTALLEFLKSLAALDGPKTIVLISEGLSTRASELFSPGDIIQSRFETMSAGSSDMNGASSTQGFSSFPGEISGLRGAAAAARAEFYVIQPNVMGGAAFRMPKTAADAINNRTDQRSNQSLDEQLIDQTSALASVASVTGGQFFQLSARATGVYDRILRESSAYYAIGFEADADDLAGKESKITLRTSRPGVAIRARRTLKAAADKPALAPSAHDMAASAAPFGDLPLSAVAYATRGPNGGIKALIVADSVERSWKEAAFTLADAKGKIAAAWPADIPAGGPLITAQVVKSGHYRLRAAAVDERGRGGAVDYEFDAQLQKAGPLTFASLMAGTVNSGAFRPRLFFEPGAQVTPYLEVYGTVPVSVSFTLTKAGDETPLLTAAGELTSTHDPDRRVATGSLSLAGLAAGKFTVRASVSVAGRRVGTVSTGLHVISR